MVKSTALLAFAASALASVASAKLLSYGEPIAATTWTAGKQESVAWSNDCSDFTGNTTLPITLNIQQNGLQVQVPGIGPIGTLDCKKPGSTKVTIPATVASGDAYSILVVNGEQSYSALFTIKSTVPAPSTSGATTAPATTTAAKTTTAAATTTAATKTTGSAPSASPSNGAGALKAGSTAALVVVAAAGLLL
ncbi:hypothetical protein BG011_006107 [Mortierella polycephala]|uniref:Yeast cell wall synthesis Kre9/Knh1-like N-terminal domain-containing protein n=1 Tax=Mortierella polycephala TaxID=41804 RepID=A0A9P6PX06_9FUNG|nr:hypothetical protein BG011_006107 [Mortierella polycephala]